MRIAESYEDDGTPIYSTTVKLELGRLAETIVEDRNKDLNHITKMMRAQLPALKIADADYEEAFISDMFFNSEAVINAEFTEDAIETAAVQFNSLLTPDLRSRYNVDWLVEDYFRRV